MKALWIYLLLLSPLCIAAQTVDTSLQAQSQTEIPQEEIKVDVEALLRQWVDSIQRTESPDEVVRRVEALGEEIDSSITALGESLKEEDPEAASSELVGQFRDSFQKIWEGLANTLTRGNLAAIFLIIGIGVGINVLLNRWVGPEDKTPYRRRLRRLRWYPLLRFLIWSLVVIFIAALLMQHPDVMWPALTALAIGLGLAVKDGLVDLLSGLWLIFERPYQIGDRIHAGGHYGEVARIGIRSTQITTLDDNLVTIPNSIILNNPVANANAGETDCMAVVKIWLPLEADLQQARVSAYEAAITSRYFNFDKGVNILFHDHISEPPGTILQIKGYVLDPKYEKAFEGDVTETVKRALVNAGVYSSNG